MRRVGLWLVIFSVLSLLIFLVKEITVKLGKRREITERIGRMPSFNFSTLSGVKFSSSMIEEGPVIIIRFHPECDHCYYEVSEILKSDLPHIASYILLIASTGTEELNQYMSRFDYSSLSSVIPLADTTWSFVDIFGNSPVPSNYIYDKDLSLVRFIAGEVKTETIMKYLTGFE